MTQSSLLFWWKSDSFRIDPVSYILIGTVIPLRRNLHGFILFYGIRLLLKGKNYILRRTSCLGLKFANAFKIIKSIWSPVPEFIDPVFGKTSPKRSFSVMQTERIGLVSPKTGSIISGTDLFYTFTKFNFCFRLVFQPRVCSINYFTKTKEEERPERIHSKVT